MEIEKIKSILKYGDMVVIAEMLGITPSNARRSLDRPGSKYHESVVNMALTINHQREQLKSAING